MSIEKNKEHLDKLNSCTELIFKSDSRKKLIIAGPGTGKTTSFKKILENLRLDKNRCLVLTFINNLKLDLEKELSDLADVYTFHGYCHLLLRRNKIYRDKLTNDFLYFPKIVHIIKSDWKILEQSDPPQFIKYMRTLNIGKEIQFYQERANYYDTVGFDDSVFRVYERLSADVENQESYQLVLVDEYQDFNLLEVSFLDSISQKSPILISGDDDQALYYYLRDSDPTFIRNLFNNDEYQKFELPYCTRCTEAVINAFQDIINEAKTIEKLSERVDKPFMYFPPLKMRDSEKYPRIKIIHTTIQNKRPKTNYFGRYIYQEISKLEVDEIQESKEKGFPTVLIIGARQYLRQVQEHLLSENIDCSYSGSNDDMELDIIDGLKILKGNKESNLGWRIVLEICQPEFLIEIIEKTRDRKINICELIPEDFKEDILTGVEKDIVESNIEDIPEAESEDKLKPTIVLSSFEGAKGLSAQYVFIIGMHEGDLPRNNDDPSDFEINKFLVALTRTRKQCHILYTTYFSGINKRPSIFLSWIKKERIERLYIDKHYWG